MSETVWVSLPLQEKNALTKVINSIESKNLTSLSVNQLIEKIENDQAPRWFEVLRQYNSIPSVNNIESLEMLDRAKSVKRKFKQRGYEQLENREFQPNQLLGLVILCYSNPNLIGPKLCKALSDNNVDNIKKEILENSARVGDRVVPWASNLRLLNYALYSNDTSVELPNGVLNRIREGARQKNISLVEVGGSLEIDVSRDSPSINGVNQPIPLHLQANDTYAESKLIEGSASVSAHNTANFSNGNDLVIGGLAGFHILKSLPVISPVLRNMGKDLVTASKHIGSFFSSKDPELADQVEQKTFLSSVTKS